MRIEHTSFANLREENKQLLLKAKEILLNAYNIYSDFNVAVAVLTKDGHIYRSCNMENASYGLTICAEPGAIQQAFSHGNYHIKTLGIVGGFLNKSLTEPPMPCGRCRQIISEASFLAGDDIEIISANVDLSKVIITSILELLPAPFSLNDLHLKSKIHEFKMRSVKKE